MARETTITPIVNFTNTRLTRLFRSGQVAGEVPVDLLPGADWLAKGYRPFGTLTDSDYLSHSALFTFSANEQYRLFHTTYEKPAEIVVVSQVFTDFKSVDVSEIRDAVKEVTLTVGGGAGFGMFKGEFETNFKNHLEDHWEYQAAAVLLTKSLFRLTLEHGPSENAKRLVPEFRSAMQAAAALAASGTDSQANNPFFDTWGTHYISGVHVGGSYYLYMTFRKADHKSTNDMNVKFKATYDACSAKTDIADRTVAGQMLERREITLHAIGGKEPPFDPSHLKDGLAKWQQDVFEFPAVCGFFGDKGQGLTPVWTLATEDVVPDARERAALRAAWEAYCNCNRIAFPDPAPISVVTAIKVAAHDKSHNARELATAGGYELIDVDLNSGAGGKFIYAATKTRKDYGKAQPDAGEAPLRNLVAVVSGGPHPTPPPGYHIIPQDLNAGAHGKFIHLFYTTERSAGLPITDIAGESTGKESKGAEYFTNQKWEPVRPWGKNDPQDMNESVHGDFVYLKFRRATWDVPPVERGA